MAASDLCAPLQSTVLHTVRWRKNFRCCTVPLVERVDARFGHDSGETVATCTEYLATGLRCDPIVPSAVGNKGPPASFPVPLRQAL
jgi:hypothetical protein